MIVKVIKSVAHKYFKIRHTLEIIMFCSTKPFENLIITGVVEIVFNMVKRLMASNEELCLFFSHRLNAASVGATLNVPPAPIGSPPDGDGSPTDSLHRFMGNGCNGTNASQTSRMVNAAVSSIDDALNDVPFAIRKKYPFELEKAIHNVKFIQHHLNRQDEYNTVISLKFISYTERL